MAGERILVVDDNPINSRLTSLLLEKEGYEVATAPDGEVALRTLETFHPRLILMDVQLPGMDGLDLTRQIKANPAYSGVVIVALTAYAMKGDEEKALQAGCDGYVSKPINTRALPRLIREYIDGRRPAAKPSYPPQNAGRFMDSSIIDLGALSERVGSNTELIREIVQMFFDRYPAIMAKARQAVTARHFKEVERAAHSIRGYLVNFHAKRASEAARALEIKGRLSDVSGIEEAFTRLQDEIELLARLLASLHGKQAAPTSA